MGYPLLKKILIKNRLLSKQCSLNLFAGDLLPDHMRIFKDNEFFRGVTLPEPDTLEPLEAKMPKTFSREGMDFLKV